MFCTMHITSSEKNFIRITEGRVLATAATAAALSRRHVCKSLVGDCGVGCGVSALVPAS
jgi:hypothetical protein